MSIMKDGSIREHSIADARRNLPTLIREAEGGMALQLTRRGKPVAMLIGCRQFDRLTAKRTGFAAAYGNFRQTTDLPGLAIDPDDVFGDVRDATPGRHTQL